MYSKHIKSLYNIIKKDIIKTPLIYSLRLSEKYGHNIYLKREDLQTTRSFKLRGSLYKIKKNIKDISNVICASAGNHAQGVAYSCNLLNIRGDIFVPSKTPLQKINRIKYYGKDKINIHLYGDNFDDCLNKAQCFSDNNSGTFIHPFNDNEIIDGQSTIAYEIFNEITPDLIISPIGGGGMISGISKYTECIDELCRVVGVEPRGACSMKLALTNNTPTKIDNIDNFVDGASVSIVGDKTFEICRNNLDSIFTVSNEKLSFDMVEFYQDDGIILEPAGCLSVSCLGDVLKKYDKGRTLNIVCVLSGGNNDITRYNEIMDLSLKYHGLIHYFVITFSQRPGELKNFINSVLGKEDDIIRFEYIKKSNINSGAVLIGIELTDKNNLKNIQDNLNRYGFNYEKVDSNILL
jgi:threonine dehydratase